MNGENGGPGALDEAVTQRRQALDEQGLTAQSGRWGIALSGGGIRSAVFSFGLVSALAKSGVFWRFDLLSTVSGGGYFGAALGKLACTSNAVQLQNELRKPRHHSPFQQQMRASNRYLTPKGRGDLFYIAAVYLRSMLAVHIELFLLCALLSTAIALWDTAVWWSWRALLPRLPHASTVYGPADQGLDYIITQMVIFSPLSLLVLLGLVSALMICMHYWYGLRGSRAYAARQNSNRRLSTCLKLTTAAALLALIDTIAQNLSVLELRVGVLGAFYSAVLLLLRMLLPLLHLKGDAGALLGRKVFLLLDIAGLFGLFILIIFWLSVCHAFLTHQMWHNFQVSFTQALIWLLPALGLVLLLMLVRVNNWKFLNRSSLHHFYRLRLSNAWLGFGQASDAAPPQAAPAARPGDLHFCHYQPWRQGGPVHLINVCLNDNTSRRGANNQDRQGHLLSLLGGGYFTLDASPHWSLIEDKKALTLATWMAISGAATAPGMGMLTRPGLASLFTTLGVRLGFWWETDYTLLRPWALKYRCLLAELLGRFSIKPGTPWFLSDGGHAENTAAWALLKAQCELIIVVDAAADPDYSFNDLENLIRRARADLAVEIEFVMPVNNHSGMFGSLDDLGDPNAISCLALARIHYPNGAHGMLILVKPNLTTGLPEDVFNYARDNPSFPQQSTADQFYDETQWESYYALGQQLGKPLTCRTLKDLLQMSGNGLQPAGHELLVTPPTQPLLSRRPTRITRKAGAVATLGLATILTSGSALYAAFQQAGTPVDNFDMSVMYRQSGDLPIKDKGKLTPQGVSKLAATLLMYQQQIGEAQFDHLRSKLRQLDTFVRESRTACKTLPDSLNCQQLALRLSENVPPREVSPMVNAADYWRTVKVHSDH